MVQRSRSVLFFFAIYCICYVWRQPSEWQHGSKVYAATEKGTNVRIAKPLLLIATPIGLLDGFYECYKLAGGLLFLMVAMVGVLVAAMATVVATIRREERESKKEGVCKV